MSDIKIIYNQVTRSYAIAFENGDVVADNGMETAIIISLFSDRYTDERPAGDRGGFWADPTLEIEGDRVGSLLWLLARGKITDKTVRQAEDYVPDALKWMVDDGVAKEINVAVSRIDQGMIIDLAIVQPDGVPRKYQLLWEAQRNAI
jgi:phage gp46-like protein